LECEEINWRKGQRGVYPYTWREVKGEKELDKES